LGGGGGASAVGRAGVGLDRPRERQPGRPVARETATAREKGAAGRLLRFGFANVLGVSCPRVSVARPACSARWNERERSGMGSSLSIVRPRATWVAVAVVFAGLSLVGGSATAEALPK